MAVSITAEGPRKGEPSTRIMRYGLRTQPAPLVRGSSRRIMSLRFRPAHISVINRRDSLPVVIGTPVRKFSFRFANLLIGGEPALSRIHVVALRASLTALILHQPAPLIKAIRSPGGLTGPPISVLSGNLFDVIDDQKVHRGPALVELQPKLLFERRENVLAHMRLALERR
jgi:hypothetical protein